MIRLSWAYYTIKLLIIVHVLIIFNILFPMIIIILICPTNYIIPACKCGDSGTLVHVTVRLL